MAVGDDSTIYDTYDKWGFIYIESDNRTAAPEKKRETTTYAEQQGENTDLRTVADVFDYKVTFLIECPNNSRENANLKIRSFNNAIRGTERTGDIKTCKRIAFYNDYKRVLIQGIPEIIAEPKEFYRDRNGKQMDCVLIELVIHVDQPSLCNFAASNAVLPPLEPILPSEADDN